MASPTQWTWIWASSRRQWRKGKAGVLWFMGSQRVGHNWATDLNWTHWINLVTIHKPEKLLLCNQPRPLCSSSTRNAFRELPGCLWIQGTNSVPTELSILLLPASKPNHLLFFLALSVIMSISLLRLPYFSFDISFIGIFSSSFFHSHLSPAYHTLAGVVYLLSHVRLFCDPMDCSPPGSSVQGITQARVLEWVAISFSRVSSWPRDGIWVSCIDRQFFTTEIPGKPQTLAITTLFSQPL